MTALGVFLFYIIPAFLLGEVLRCVYLEHRGDRIPILLYHRLISRKEVEAGRIPDREPIYVSYDDSFDAQMRDLRDHGFTTLSLDDFLAIRRGESVRPAKPVVVTFDDGYESNHALAWPVLHRYGMKATIFVAPQPDDYTRNLVAGIDGFLSADQMRDMDRGGVAIESHTLTHCVLTDLDDAAARHELVESKRRLSEILGRPVRHLAVPRSGHSHRIRRLARQAGYLTVCANGKGSSNGWSSLYALPRIVVERDTTPEDLDRALRPAGAVILRLVGNLKRIPTLLFGSVRTQKMRRALYSSPLGGLFLTRCLVRVLAGWALLYAVGIALFTWHLMSR
ncbi:MAG: polysaccharide deacetylase family protein [Candidatus Rokubacteria bacterium]|nr:polysaccharide deacetylase family protein [Candidatus Rokubacteria bacterium]